VGLRGQLLSGTSPRSVVLRDRTAGIEISTKQPVPGGGFQKIGGYWTSDGRLVMVWN
jgi:hypothetical protein